MKILDPDWQTGDAIPHIEGWTDDLVRAVGEASAHHGVPGRPQGGVVSRFLQCRPRREKEWPEQAMLGPLLVC